MSLYEKVLANLKKKYGVKIIHRKLKDSYGLAQPDGIVMSSALRGTIFGILILHHELKHWLDYKNNHHKKFYSESFLKLNWTDKRKIQLIWRVEWGCCQFANNQCKKLGIDTSKMNYCDESWVRQNLLPIWIKYYLD